MSTALYDEQVSAVLKPGTRMNLVANPMYDIEDDFDYEFTPPTAHSIASQVAAGWNALPHIERVHAVILFASMAFFVIALCVFVLGVHPALPETPVSR